VAAIVSVSKSGVVLGNQLSRVLITKFPGKGPDFQETFQLSPTETSILSLVAQGKKDSVVAKELNIGLRTIHEHLTRVYRKLGAANRVQACLIALQAGIIPPIESTKDSNQHQGV